MTTICEQARRYLGEGRLPDSWCHLVYFDGAVAGLSEPLPPNHDFRGHDADYYTLAELAWPIGTRVMGGRGDTFDVGTIHGIRGEFADVGWESGQRTPAYVADLLPYDPEEAERRSGAP